MAERANPYPWNIYPTNAPFINDVITQENSCGAPYSNPKACYNNGEFENIGVDMGAADCCYNSAPATQGTKYNGSPCIGCKDGGCLFTGGKPLRCKRIKFLADPLQCALTGKPVQINKAGTAKVTCDPEWLPPYGKQYLSIIKDYCTSENNFLNDSRCFEFCTQNDCTSLVNTYCVGENLTTDTCKKQCFSTQSDYDCTTQLLDFCKDTQNQSLDVCSCFLPKEVYDAYYEQLFGNQVGNSKQVINEVNKLPTCSFTRCSTGNFKPRGPVNCPIQAVCVNSIVFNSKGDITFNGDQDFQLTCQQALGTAANPYVPPSSGLQGWEIALIVIAIIVVIVLIIVGVVFGTKKPKNDNKKII